MGHAHFRDSWSFGHQLSWACHLSAGTCYPHTKFDVSTITCNEEMKGNARCKNCRFGPPFGGLSGNAQGLSTARLKAHCRLPISDNLTFLASSHGCGTVKRNLSKSAFSDRVGHFERKYLVDWDVAHNLSMDHKIEERCSYNSAAGRFHTKKLCSRRFWQKSNFIGIIAKLHFVPPFGVLGVTYMVHLWLVVKHVFYFLLVLIDLFSPAFTVEALWAYICQSSSLWKGVGHFERKFQGKGSSINGFRRQNTESLSYHMALFAWSYV